MPSRLENHLATWLGQWPPTGSLTVTTAPGRTEPGWDGKLHPVVGVASPEGTVLSVPPEVVDEARRLAARGGLQALAGPPARVAPGTGPARRGAGGSEPGPARHGAGGSEPGPASGGSSLGRLLGKPDYRLYAGTFRWSEAPAPAADLPDAGVWLPADDPRVPTWLLPFGDPVLVALRDGAYTAGVGIKRHDRYGHELAVGTEARFRGQGLARRLTAQAARRVVAEGRVATYLHDPDNTASARVAEAAGFPDRGWKILGLWP